MTIQANQGFGVSIFGATSAGGGGSTSPGGSSGQLQYNASGSFGGMAGTSWDDTNRALTLTGATVTTSQPVLNLSQTWNDGAGGTVTFTGLKFNATDTASAAASLLLDLQVGGSSKFSIRKGGVVQVGGSTSFQNNVGIYTPAINVGDGATALTSFAGNQINIWNSNVNTVSINNSGLRCASGTSVGFGALVSNADTFLTRGAGASASTPQLQLGAADAAAPVAQTLQVQSVVAGTTNTAGANWTLKGSAGTGTGAGGSIIFQVAPAGSSGTAQNAYSSVLTISSSGLITSTPASGIYNILAGSTVAMSSFGMYMYSGATLNWTSGAAYNNTVDLTLARDAANTLALRNGTSAQKLRIYNTYTSSTSYEDYEIDWQTTANTALVGPTKGSGGGTQRVQRLQYLEDGGTGSTTPSLGTTCPAASATIKSWIKVVTSDGTTGYIPCWA